MDPVTEHSSSHWKIGQHLVLDEGRRKVVVEDICGNLVCCRWSDRGIQRTSWIPRERLRCAAPDRIITIA